MRVKEIYNKRTFHYMSTIVYVYLTVHILIIMGRKMSSSFTQKTRKTIQIICMNSSKTYVHETWVHSKLIVS